MMTRSRLIQVWIDLPESERQETLQASFVAKQLYQIEEIPFETKEVNYKDIVLCEDKNNTPRLITKVVKPSGYRTLFVKFQNPISIDRIREKLVTLKQKGVTYRRSGTHAYSLNIPPDADIEAVLQHIEQLRISGTMIDDDREGLGAVESILSHLKFLMHENPKLEDGLGKDEDLGL